MRKDLNKQLCERERIGSRRLKYSAVRHKRKFTAMVIDEDTDLPVNESMQYRYGWNTRNFNENLNPLWGILRKAVGRKWDDFYSELSATFDKRSVINNHILEHLYQKILVNVHIDEDGRYYVFREYAVGRDYLEDIKYSFADYYVDPKTGIICKLESKLTWRQRQQAARLKKRLEYVEDHAYDAESNKAYHKINGVWFVFDLVEAPKARYEYVAPSKDPEELYDCYGKMLEWDRLPFYKQRAIGRGIFIGREVRDEYTGERVFFNTSTSRLEVSFGDAGVLKKTQLLKLIPALNKGHYHANKRTANKKEIRKIEELIRRSKTDITTLS